MSVRENESATPQCLITVGDTLLESSKFMVESVDVNISAGTQSNSCNVTVLCEYDYKNGELIGSSASTFSQGEKVLVELGYNSTKKVFMGYINSVSVEFSSEGVVISFSCLDARGLLMKNNSRKKFENKNTQQIVDELLAPVKSYTGGIEIKVSDEADKEQPVFQNYIDSYSFICTLAKLTDSSFCMTDDKLRFVKNIFKSSSLQETYTWGKDIISFSRMIDLADQVGSVEVVGASVVNKKDRIREKVEYTKKIAGVEYKDTEVKNTMIRTKEQARKYGEALLFESSLKLCTGSASVLGNQDLTPGEKVKFERLDPKIDGEYYIASVNHRFSSGSFTTSIGFCSDSL